MKTMPVILLSLMLGIGGAGLAGCDRQGPAERTGERIDDAVDEASDRIDDAADQMEDTVDD